MKNLEKRMKMDFVREKKRFHFFKKLFHKYEKAQKMPAIPKNAVTFSIAYFPRTPKPSNET